MLIYIHNGRVADDTASSGFRAYPRPHSSGILAVRNARCWVRFARRVRTSIPAFLSLSSRSCFRIGVAILQPQFSSLDGGICPATNVLSIASPESEPHVSCFLFILDTALNAVFSPSARMPALR